MPDKKTIHRIQKALDRALTPGEEKALKRLLSEDSDARSLHQELGQMVSLLGSVPDMDVPSGLEKRILNSLDPKRYSPGTVAENKRRPAFRIRRQWAVGFAVGVAFTVVLLLMFWIPGISIRGLGIRFLSGSVGVGEDRPYRTIRAMAFDPEGCAGTVSHRQWKDRVLITVEFRVPSESDLILRFTPGDLRFEGIRPENDTSFRFESHPDRIQTSLTGVSPLTFSFRTLRTEPVSVDLQLLRSGKTVWNQSVLIRAKE